ncbi:MAG: HNH endonuclease [Clostridia bacterium]|nr:HNH endonuclease [Clostridia bacterium]
MKTDHVYPIEAIPFNTILKANDFCKYEKKRTSKIKIKDSFGITVDVNASYSSPKGKNQYRRCFKYRYENVLYCYTQWKNSARFKTSAAYERSLMTASLRYDILKRDNYRCQICGASANDGVKLHVDHIIPVSKGGKTEPSNLQTLCERCNLGKSNKM